LGRREAWRRSHVKHRAEQIRAFLEGSQEIRFQGEGRAEVYAWVTRLLREQGYRQ